MEMKYQQKIESGRWCKFSESTVIHEDIPPDPSLASEYIDRGTCHVGTQFSKFWSQHEVTPLHTEQVSHGMNHVEGGWPETISADNSELTLRYRKKVQKDESYQHTVMETVFVVGNYKQKILEKSQVYFKDNRVVVKREDMASARIINVFRDPKKEKRAATSLSWHPVDNHKLAVAYSCLEFQRAPKNMSSDSYIWNIENNKKPEMTLKPISPLVCLEYNLKNISILIGGSYNGQIGYWDTRSGSQPVQMSAIEHSHKDPVYKVIWLQSKIGTEAFSASTDGQVLFWDIRNISEPTKQLILDPAKSKNLNNAYSAFSMEFDNTMPKFLVGTEQGLVVLCNRKLETTDEPIVCTYSGHHGPVYAVQRNPFFPKYFLTVADWTARIWSEDIRLSSIMSTKYHTSHLLDGCWSPVRPAVFFTVKMDGTLDVWDILLKQKDPVLSLKVCDETLYSIRVKNDSPLMCCGSQLGTVTLLKMSPNLCTLQSNEKGLVSEMFERETKREKILEACYKERHQMKQSCPKEDEDGRAELQELLAETETEFFETIDAEKKKIQDEEK